MEKISKLIIMMIFVVVQGLPRLFHPNGRI